MLAKPPLLVDFLGKKIDQICPFSLGKDDAQNHCAHFVSHVMGYEFDETCKNYSLADKQKAEHGATIRVNRIFNTAKEVGPWIERPLRLSACLIFVTISGNMWRSGRVLTMKDNKKKHVGIFVDGVIWHYSNTRDGVAKDPETTFITKFKHAYITAGHTVEFFYASFLA